MRKQIQKLTSAALAVMVSFASFSVPTFAEESAPDDVTVISETATTEADDSIEPDAPETADDTDPSAIDDADKKDETGKPDEVIADDEESEITDPIPDSEPSASPEVTPSPEATPSASPEASPSADPEENKVEEKEELAEEESADAEDPSSEEIDKEEKEDDSAATYEHRLIVISSTGVREEDVVISKDDDMYLLGFKDRTSMEAALEYYGANSEHAEPDMPITVAEGDIQDTNTDISKDNNPIDQMKYLMEGEKVNEDGIVIGMIDTGADISFTNVVSAVSVLGEDASDDNGHGTRMAEFMAEEYPEAKIVSIKAMDKNGVGTVSSVYAAFEYAIEQGVDIINLSASAFKRSENTIIIDEINKAAEAGIKVVGSAGNNGLNIKYFVPGSVDNAIIIGSCDEEGNILTDSNYGESVDYIVTAGSTSEAAARFSGIMAKALAEEKEVESEKVLKYVWDGTDHGKGEPTVKDSSDFHTDLPPGAMDRNGSTSGNELYNANMKPGNMALSSVTCNQAGARKDETTKPNEVRFTNITTGSISSPLSFTATYNDWMHVLVNGQEKVVKATVTLDEFTFYKDANGTYAPNIELDYVLFYKNFEGGWSVYQKNEEGKYGAMAYNCTINFYVDGQPYVLPTTGVRFRSLNIGEFVAPTEYYDSNAGYFVYKNARGEIDTAVKQTPTFNELDFSGGNSHTGSGYNGSNGYGPYADATREAMSNTRTIIWEKEGIKNAIVGADLEWCDGSYAHNKDFNRSMAGFIMGNGSHHKYRIGSISGSIWLCPEYNHNWEDKYYDVYVRYVNQSGTVIRDYRKQNFARLAVGTAFGPDRPYPTDAEFTAGNVEYKRSTTQADPHVDNTTGGVSGVQNEEADVYVTVQYQPKVVPHLVTVTYVDENNPTTIIKEKETLATVNENQAYGPFNTLAEVVYRNVTYYRHTKSGETDTDATRVTGTMGTKDVDVIIYCRRKWTLTINYVERNNETNVLQDPTVKTMFKGDTFDINTPVTQSVEKHVVLQGIHVKTAVTLLT